ncbi:MAG TPA: aldo/keto reductase [Burkholderiales bacterium]|nr:aldo/keto reductase [Burkholderiales bacterium]
MNTRPLGKSGVQVSAVGLGCNAFGGRIDLEASRAVVHKALDLGVTLFDTANSYGNRYGTTGGSEIALGKILGARRKDIVLATKWGTQSGKHPSIPVEGASRAEIIAALDASLKRLNTDWIDLYQLHHPDPKTPIEETLRTLDDLVKQGKVRHIGCSNAPAWRIADADWAARHHGLAAFATCQGEYSMLMRGIEREVLPAMQHYGLGLLPTYPLAAGFLTGKYQRDRMPEGARLTAEKRQGEKYLTAANWTLVEGIECFAGQRGWTLLELAVAWLLSKPVVSSVIAGATKPEQVELNVKAGARTLTSAEMNEIESLLLSAGSAPLSAGGQKPAAALTH